MGKDSKDPIKIAKKQHKKIERQNNETTDDALSRNYAKFDKINYDSDSSNTDSSNKESLKGKLPIIDCENNLEYMIKQGISQYIVGKDSNVHCGIGAPLTQKEFDQLKESKVIVNKK